MYTRGGNLTLKADMYTETYYTKNDTQRRYPRQAKRVALSFPYNPEINNAMKNELKSLEGFYNVKWSNNCLLYTSPSPRDRG